MIIKLTVKEEPSLFEDVSEFIVKTNREYRKEKSFYTSHIIEFKDCHAEDFPEIENFEKYLGLWKTNTIVATYEGDSDEYFSILNRVIPIIKNVELIEYLEISEPPAI